MQVGCFLVDTQSVDSALGVICAEALIRSVRATMPGVPVVQFTDERTAAVSGVDVVARLPLEPLARLRVRHQAACEGDWLFVDTDVVIQRDVRPVFDQSFDIAITTRNWKHLKVAVGFSERMPFNTGVVFSRCPAFWQDVYKRLGKLPAEAQAWMGDQQAICDLIASKPRYDIAFLKGSRYNLPPAMAPDDTELSAQLEAKASILHFKGGERKALLLQRIRREAAPCT